MNFEYPQLLFLLPLILAAGFFGYGRIKRAASRARLFLMLGSVFCLVLALANPTWSTVPQPTVSKATNFVVILDASQSMFCREEGGTRMDQAVRFLRTLLPQLSGSSIALIYFAGDAQIGSPYTQDPGAIRLFLNSTVPNMTGAAGTKSEPLQTLLAETLSTEGNLEESRRKQIGLLFSDGEFFDNTGKLERWLASTPALTLYTFGCGKARTEVPKFDLSGPVPNAFSKAQPKLLQTLASAGRGRFFSLAGIGNDEAIARNLTAGIREVVSAGQPVPKYEFMPFAAASLILLLAYQIVPLFSSFRRSTAIQVAIILALAGAMSLGMSGAAEKQTTFSQALDALKQKQFQKAIDQLQKLKNEGASEEVDVAIGNAYFSQGKYDDAIAHYREALNRNPQNQRARWNWEVALKRKSQPGPQPTPPPPAAKPPQLPRESQALLKYSDQMEQEQMKDMNNQNAKPSEFAW